MSTTGCGWCPEPEEGRGNPGWGRARSQGARQRGRRRHSDVSTVYLLLGYLVHGVHTANTTQAPQGRQRPGLRSYGRAGAPPRPPLLPPTWPGLDPHTHTKRPGRSPPPKGHPGGSLRRPGNPGPPLHLRTRWCRASRRDAIPFPSPRGCSPGWLGWKRGVSSGGEGAGAGAGGAPGRGSVGMVGHVKGLPGGPRVVPAALVLAQRRQPVHLREKEMSAAPHGVCPPPPPPPTTVGYGPWGPPSPWGQSLQGPPAHRDTVLGIPHAPATAQPLASPSHGDRALGVPHLTGHNPWCVPITPRDTAFGIPPPTGTELSVSRVTRGGMAYPTWPLASPVPPWGRSPHFPPWRQYCAPSMGTMVLGIPCPVGHSPWCLPSPRGTRPSPSPIPRGTATGVPPAMGTQPSVSPPRQGTQNLSTPLLQGARPHHLCALDELLGSGGGVVPLPAPGAERRRLQRPPVGEGEGPWPHQRARVDGVEVDGSLLLALTPRTGR